MINTHLSRKAVRSFYVSKRTTDEIETFFRAFEEDNLKSFFSSYTDEEISKLCDVLKLQSYQKQERAINMIILIQGITQYRTKIQLIQRMCTINLMMLGAFVGLFNGMYFAHTSIKTTIFGLGYLNQWLEPHQSITIFAPIAIVLLVCSTFTLKKLREAKKIVLRKKHSQHKIQKEVVTLLANELKKMNHKTRRRYTPVGRFAKGVTRRGGGR